MEPIVTILALLLGATVSVIWGSVMAFQLKSRYGYILNTAGLIAFWMAGLMPYIHQHQEGEIIPVPNTFTLNHVSLDRPVLNLAAAGSSLQDGAFLASRNGKTYHLPECSHYATKIRGPIWYASKDQAEADGKVPCSECLGHK